MHILFCGGKLEQLQLDVLYHTDVYRQDVKTLTLQTRNAIQSGFVGVHRDLVGVKESADGIKDGVNKIQSKMYEHKSERESPISVVLCH